MFRLIPEGKVGVGQSKYGARWQVIMFSGGLEREVLQDVK